MTAPEPVAQFIENVCIDVAELPDRTSPEDRPEWMLVSAEELESCLRAHLPILLASPLMGVERQDRIALKRTIESGPWFRTFTADEEVSRAEINSFLDEIVDALPAQSGAASPQPREGYVLDADLLREAIEDDGLSRSTLKIMARMTVLQPTPEILDWAKAVMTRRMIAEKETP